MQTPSHLHSLSLCTPQLGYWTDNGAWYHYLCSECCGGGGSQGSCPCPAECGGNTTMQEVMLEVKADWAKRKIPARYFLKTSHRTSERTDRLLNNFLKTCKQTFPEGFLKTS